MSYLGNQPTAGENNSFKILDDLTSYTQTFDGSSATVVSIADDTLTFSSHRFVTGQRITYTHGGGTAIGGLTSGTAYFVIKNDQNTIKLASSLANANSSTAINLSALGTGTSHTLNVAFDGTNTKFVVTYDSGTKAQMTRAAQLQISINGVIQQPHDTATPATGFGITVDSVIVFSTAPLSTDVFWGNLVANNFPTFDIADNSVDTFTGNNSTTSFTLSKTPANNQNILVTLDGVVQYPSDAFTVRAYSVSENVLTFVGAPGNNVAIQVRHIGFAGATSSAVTGFYGRTGNVVLTNQDHITVGSISSVGNINSSGIITATSFVGDGSSLTGVSGFATALSATQTSPLNQIFKIAKTLTIGAGTSVSVQVGSDEGNVAFTRASNVVVSSGATFTIVSGTTLITNVLNVF